MNSGLPSVRSWIRPAKPGGNACSGKLQRDISLDRRLAQVDRRRSRGTGRAPSRSSFNDEERMLRLRQLRRTARRDDQQARVVEPPRQVAEQVRRRRIRPVHVVEPQHDRLHPPDLFEERGDLALQALLRSRRPFRRPAAPPTNRCSDGGISCTYQLGASARIRRVQAAKLLVPLQAVERFEHRQVGFGAGQPLRASASSDAHGFAAFLQLLTNASTSVVLPTPASPETTTMRALPRCARSNSWLQRRELVFAPDDVRARRRAGAA